MTLSSSSNPTQNTPSAKATGLSKVIAAPDNLRRLQLALKNSLRHASPDVSDLLADESQSLALLENEIACARRFQFELPNDLPQAITTLESAVCETMGMPHVLLFLFNPNTGTYTCVSDEKQRNTKPRELAQVSEHFLKDWLNTSQVLYTHLFSEEDLVGIVAVASPLDTTQETRIWDRMRLELMGVYLGNQLRAYQQLKQTLQRAMVQKTMLVLSNQLITAVDQEGVLTSVLEATCQKLGFDLAQYIELDPSTGQGSILIDYSAPERLTVTRPGSATNSATNKGGIRSFLHAGLASKRKQVAHHDSLLGLFQSEARRKPVLVIPGNHLGEKPIADRFHLPKIKGKSPEIYTTVILPVFDPASGHLRGSIHLYRTTPDYLDEETFEIAEEMVALISLALSRVMVLEKALEMASTDELTGLTNRRGFYERFEAEIERARRQQTSLSCAIIDVDFFKKLNDTYGHLTGDLVLKTLATLFKTSFRRSDVVCRFGGEEFAILLPDTNLSVARDLMERIRRKVSELAVYSLDGDPLTTTISIGLMEIPTSREFLKPTESLISQTLAQADSLLYQAKASGRNQVMVA